MRRLILVVLFFAVIGCNKENAIEPVPSGAFQYRAYDTTGTLIVNGSFTLIIQDSSHIKGEWHFTKMNDPHDVTGPQFGDGQLSGIFLDSILSINLNPKFVDNNVLLCGRFTGNDYIGTWNWMSYIGWTGRGSFDAHRQ